MNTLYLYLSTFLEYLCHHWRNLIKDCRQLLSDNFIFQQDGAPAHTAALAQEWIKKKCPGFIGKMNGHQIRQISVHWIIVTADIHH